MKPMFKMMLPALAVLALAAIPACDKKTDPKPAAGATGATDGDKAGADKAAADKAATEKAAADQAAATKAAADKAAADKAAADKAAADKAAADKAATDATAKAAGGPDYVKFVIEHSDPKKGPVNGEFKTFKVVKANIDLAKPETAMAVIEVDLNSVVTGIDKRDGHLKSPDFFDAAKFGKMTVSVYGVAPADAPDSYKATATLNLHGVEHKLPVAFKVVSKNADGSIVVEGGTKGLDRTKWGVGGTPEASGAATTFDAMLRLTLANK